MGCKTAEVWKHKTRGDLAFRLYNLREVGRVLMVFHVSLSDHFPPWRELGQKWSQVQVVECLDTWVLD